MSGLDSSSYISPSLLCDGAVCARGLFPHVPTVSIEQSSCALMATTRAVMAAFLVKPKQKMFMLDSNFFDGCQDLQSRLPPIKLLGMENLCLPVDQRAYGYGPRGRDWWATINYVKNIEIKTDTLEHFIFEARGERVSHTQFMLPRASNSSWTETDLEAAGWYWVGYDSCANLCSVHKLALLEGSRNENINVSTSGGGTIGSTVGLWTFCLRCTDGSATGAISVENTCLLPDSKFPILSTSILKTKADSISLETVEIGGCTVEIVERNGLFGVWGRPPDET
jgi:hypothetical protein